MPKSDAPWTVLLVDDNPAYLDAVCAWLGTRPEFDVLGTAANGREALLAIDALDPDLVLMDAAMPQLDGFETTRRIREAGDDRWVVLISFHDSTPVRNEAWASGADGFVSKADLIDTLPDMVRALAAGDSVDGGPGRGGARGVRPPAQPGRSRKPPVDPGGAERRGRDRDDPVRRVLRALGLGAWRRPAGMALAWRVSGVGDGPRAGSSRFRKTEE
jgi:CheY-like chemotaxis protein